ncbi:hypothetical protein HanRHA438_Chr14g0672741 [Helianthus annuus]|nr:hypothetical protein HanXRQr2_Chr14g0661571 [Helianthus annuus]KAJ0465521.1 hypothetical protein HanHA300_Chr14g0539091 [Helianthus annuus]KAJ0487114.1 hypothetical protein HanHA89_Chr14g0586861 [Helianthus annuus]KAJ0661236.1 hypothetical protein HanOQP8_Chr14g0546331 [Helianthus annuus]KAJ0841833.1 hypothetical protein HanPSC8_Chr14g0634821 [Helianthus annuus]
MYSGVSSHRFLGQSIYQSHLFVHIDLAFNRFVNPYLSRVDSRSSGSNITALRIASSINLQPLPTFSVFWYRTFGIGTGLVPNR